MRHSQGQKVKGQVTRSCNVVAQKHRIYPVNVTRKWKCICLIGNRGRGSEWRGQIFGRNLVNRHSDLEILRMCGENMPKTRLLCCKIATILVLLLEIVAPEHDGEGSF